MDTSYSINVDAPRMTPQELAAEYGDFLRNPAAPRPEKPEFPGRYFDADALAKEQRQWDNADAERQRLAAWVADNRAKEATEAKRKEAERDAARQAERTKARADLEASMRRTYLGNPAVTEHDWEAEKDRLIREKLTADFQARDQAAREASFRRTREAY